VGSVKFICGVRFLEFILLRGILQNDRQGRNVAHRRVNCQ